jgi:hypothetical protein
VFVACGSVIRPCGSWRIWSSRTATGSLRRRLKLVLLFPPHDCSLRRGDPQPTRRLRAFWFPGQDDWSHHRGLHQLYEDLFARATFDTDAPGARLSATIRRFSSSDQKRRRRVSLGFSALAGGLHIHLATTTPSRRRATPAGTLSSSITRAAPGPNRSKPRPSSQTM